jgi:hypothetical protein
VRTTVFSTDDSRIIPDVVDEPAWELYSEYDGQPLHSVRLAGLDVEERAQVQLNEIAAGS